MWDCKLRLRLRQVPEGTPGVGNTGSPERTYMSSNAWIPDSLLHKKADSSCNYYGDNKTLNMNPFRSGRSLTATAAIGGLSFVSLFAFAVPAFAHAYPVAYTPGDGCTTATLPPEVIMDTSEGITAASVQVTSTSGQSIATGPVHFTSGKSEADIPINQSASPGAYVVQWQFTSVDTHVTSSSWSFTYNPQAQGLDDQHSAAGSCGKGGLGDATLSGTPTGGSTTASTMAPTGSSSSSKSGSSSTGIIIAIVAVVVVVGGGAAIAMSRKNSGTKA